MNIGQKRNIEGHAFLFPFWNCLLLAKIGKVYTYSSTQREERLEKRKGGCLSTVFADGTGKGGGIQCQRQHKNVVFSAFLSPHCKEPILKNRNKEIARPQSQFPHVGDEHCLGWVL